MIFNENRNVIILYSLESCDNVILINMNEYDDNIQIPGASAMLCSTYDDIYVGDVYCGCEHVPRCNDPLLTNECLTIYQHMMYFHC